MIRGKSLIAKKSPSSGFTLMETAIVIAIAAFMLSGAAALFKTWINESVIVTNQQRLVTIQQALTTYEKKFNKLPCPASYASLLATPGYGHADPEPCTTVPGGGALVAGRKGAIDPLGKGPAVQGMILIGALPTRDLGLPESYIANTYGYRYTYAVTQAETVAPLPASPPPGPPYPPLGDPSYPTGYPPYPPNPPGLNPYGGAIEVKDGGGFDVTPPPTDVAVNPAQLGTALYVVVDHGADGKGTSTINGGATSGCPAGSGLDYDNCDKYGSKFFRTAPFSTKPGATWFDDSIIYDTGGSAKVCTTASANSTTAGSSEGYDITGVDKGYGTGWDFITPVSEIFYFTFDNYFWMNPVAPLIPPPGQANYNGNSPTADAYCPDATFHVVTGGCSDTAGFPAFGGGGVTNAFGGDISVTSIDSAILPTFIGFVFIGPTYYYETVQIPLGHPTLSATGIMGWECNGSSAYGIDPLTFQPKPIYTQAYVVCCNR